MARCDKLLEKARNNPRGLRFQELQRLAKCYDFYLDHTTGSHHISDRAGSRARLNLQPTKGGQAKPYQVRQVLAEIEAIQKEEE